MLIGYNLIFISDSPAKGFFTTATERKTWGIIMLFLDQLRKFIRSDSSGGL